MGGGNKYFHLYPSFGRSVFFYLSFSGFGLVGALFTKEEQEKVDS